MIIMTDNCFSCKKEIDYEEDDYEEFHVVAHDRQKAYDIIVCENCKDIFADRLKEYDVI